MKTVNWIRALSKLEWATRMAVLTQREVCWVETTRVLSADGTRWITCPATAR